jgi:hypothetical protein
MSKRTLFALLPLLVATLPANAQEKERDKEKEKTEARAPAATTPLRLSVVFARYQGEKKVGSVPYTLSITDDNRPVRLRMGIQVPIKVGEPGGIQYKDIGNNLDCRATPALAREVFNIACSFEQSSVYATEGERAAAGSAVGNLSLASQPLFRVFRSETNLLLRDGQSALNTAATDPVSGEVLKIEVTLNVVR